MEVRAEREAVLVMGATCQKTQGIRRPKGTRRATVRNQADFPLNAIIEPPRTDSVVDDDCGDSSVRLPSRHPRHESVIRPAN